MYAVNGQGGRNGEFMTGVYHNQSVLDNLLPAGNGYSARDKGRLASGGKAVLPSGNGRSTTTNQRRQWLDSPLRTFS